MKAEYVVTRLAGEICWVIVPDRGNSYKQRSKDPERGDSKVAGTLRGRVTARTEGWIGQAGTGTWTFSYAMVGSWNFIPSDKKPLEYFEQRK